MTITTQALMYHIQRLGSRRDVALLFGVGKNRISKLLPMTDQERYSSGEMVNISGVLARKCNTCHTARELEHFQANPSNKSGCKHTCSYCRKVRKSE